MKKFLLLFLPVLITGCDNKEYYSSGHIYLRNCYRQNTKVIFEYVPFLETGYYSPGADVRYNTDSTTVWLSFVRQPVKTAEKTVDVRSSVAMSKSLIFYSVRLPVSVNKIIVSSPDTAYTPQ